MFPITFPIWVSWHNFGQRRMLGPRSVRCSVDVRDLRRGRARMPKNTNKFVAAMNVQVSNVRLRIAFEHGAIRDQGDVYPGARAVGLWLTVVAPMRRGGGEPR